MIIDTLLKMEKQQISYSLMKFLNTNQKVIMEQQFNSSTLSLLEFIMQHKFVMLSFFDTMKTFQIQNKINCKILQETRNQNTNSYWSSQWYFNLNLVISYSETFAFRIFLIFLIPAKQWIPFLAIKLYQINLLFPFLLHSVFQVSGILSFILFPALISLNTAPYNFSYYSFGFGYFDPTIALVSKVTFIHKRET